MNEYDIAEIKQGKCFIEGINSRDIIVSKLPRTYSTARMVFGDCNFIINEDIH